MANFRGSAKDLMVPPGLAGSTRELPVFTFPNSLQFFADDKDSLRQILTVYNPYDFPIKFRGNDLIKSFRGEEIKRPKVI